MLIISVTAWSSIRRQVFKLCNSSTTLCAYYVGPKLEQLMEQLRNDLSVNPPLPGAFTPVKGSLCVAQFDEDGLW